MSPASRGKANWGRDMRPDCHRRTRARSTCLVTEAQRHLHLEKTVLTCINQSCGTQWQLSDVVIKDEGQGPLFRCALCGARNYLKRVETKDGRVIYKQIEGKPLK